MNADVLYNLITCAGAGDDTDTDGDGLGNACDANDGEGTSVLSRAQVRAYNPSSIAPNGKVRIIALIADDTTGNRLPEDLTVTGDVQATVTAGAFTMPLRFGTCTARSARLMRCATGSLKATFKLVPQGGNVCLLSATLSAGCRSTGTADARHRARCAAAIARTFFAQLC